MGVSRFKKDNDIDPDEVYSYIINVGVKGDIDTNGDIICSKTDSFKLIISRYL